MTCKNCGTQLPDNAKFCTKCGTPADTEDLNISAAGVERAFPRGFSAKKNIIIIIIAAILLIGGGVTAIAVVNSHSATSGVSDKLKLAERYLNEQNYEQAVIEYQKVLEIEPMNVDAYLGLADAYIGMGDKDKALETLEDGFEKIENQKIKDKLAELTRNSESLSEASSSVLSSAPVSSTTASSPTASNSTFDFPDTAPTIQVTAATDFIGKNKDYFMHYFDGEYKEVYFEGGLVYNFMKTTDDKYYAIEIDKSDLDSGYSTGYVMCYGNDPNCVLSNGLGKTDSICLGMSIDEVFNILGETEIQEWIFGSCVKYDLHGYEFLIVLDNSRQKVVEFDVYLSSYE